MLVIGLKRQIELSRISAQPNVFRSTLHELKTLCNAVGCNGVDWNTVIVEAVVAVISIYFELIVALVEAKISIGRTAVVLCWCIDRFGAVFDVTKRTQVLEMRTINHISRSIRGIVNLAEWHDNRPNSCLHIKWIQLC